MSDRTCTVFEDYTQGKLTLEEATEKLMQDSRPRRRLTPAGWVMLVSLAALALWFLTRCGPAPIPVPPPPPRPADFDPVAACAAGQARLFDLQCKRTDGSGWWMTPGGKPFADECVTAWKDGRDWRGDGIACIADCSQIEAAYRGEIRCEP